MEIDKKINTNRGLYLSALLVLIPMFAWIPVYDFGSMELWQIIAVLVAKIGAFGGMAMFAVSLILSGRYSWMEKLFGGLDKMYIAHRFLGSFSLILLFLHPVALTLIKLTQGAALKLWTDSTNIAVMLGVVSLYIMLGLVIWSLYTKSKYETFVRIHRYLGYSFILGAVHAFMAGSVLSLGGFMYFYMLALTIFGSLSFLSYSVLRDIFHAPIRYKVISVNKFDDLVEVQLEPISRIISFAPGQFVYIMFDQFQEHGYHPISISSGRRSSTLRLVMRHAGDFTSAIDKLKKGSTASVKGPYGNFTLDLSNPRKQLWIAGGIGVTPFLSGAMSLRKSTDSGHIEMIYASGDVKPYGLEELEQIERTNKVFNYSLFAEDKLGFVSFEAIKSQVPDIAERIIYICGPPPMLNALRTEAEAAGYGRNLVYEEFSY